MPPHEWMGVRIAPGMPHEWMGVCFTGMPPHEWIIGTATGMPFFKIIGSVRLKFYGLAHPLGGSELIHPLLLHVACLLF